MTRSIQYRRVDYLVCVNMDQVDNINETIICPNLNHYNRYIVSNSTIAYDTDAEEMLDEVDEMYEEDREFVESEKVPKQLLLGTVVFLPSDPYIQQLGLAITPTLFLDYPFHHLKNYMQVYSAQYRMYNNAVLSFISNKSELKKINNRREQNYQFDIVCIENEPNGVMITDTVPMQIVILKTFWLRILQRTWKRKYKSFMARLNEMKQPTYLHERERKGRVSFP